MTQKRFDYRARFHETNTRRRRNVIVYVKTNRLPRGRYSSSRQTNGCRATKACFEVIVFYGCRPIRIKDPNYSFYKQHSRKQLATSALAVTMGQYGEASRSDSQRCYGRSRVCRCVCASACVFGVYSCVCLLPPILFASGPNLLKNRRVCGAKCLRCEACSSN